VGEERVREEGGGWGGVNNAFRIFYNVDRRLNQVLILAIGEERGNRLYISGKDIEL
jgi:hypothetical protein